MVRGRAALFVVIGAQLGACLRAPISGEELGDTDADGTSTGAQDDVDGLSMSGPILPDDDGTTPADTEASPACHPSYLPCLPVVDDLDCDEVRAMDAAPVEVVGEDAYGLDADDDGIGCEG